MWHGGCFISPRTARVSGKDPATTSKEQETTMAAIARISDNHKRIAILAVLSFIALC
jgi:hypothetical protein